MPTDGAGDWSGVDHLILGGWGMQRTQGGALLDARPTRQDSRGDRAQIRERRRVWIATEGANSTAAAGGIVGRAAPARAGRRVRRGLPAGRVGLARTRGYRPRDRHARDHAAEFLPGARGGDGGGEHRRPDHLRPRARSAGRCGEGCEKRARQPDGALRAAAGEIEEFTEAMGRAQRRPHSGGVYP